MRVLITGSAGFIGMHLSMKLLQQNHFVIGIDNLNDYYDVGLKKSRNKILSNFSNYKFLNTDLQDKRKLDVIFNENNPTHVINLAAQAGVRYSIKNPHVYGESNLLGFINILESFRNSKAKHFLFASSSSVYGNIKNKSSRESDDANQPLSLYAATKRSNELIAYSYNKMYGIPITGLRFFTAYGPWGRPDMAYFKFTKDILLGREIEIFNMGRLARDYTYIDDLVECVIRLMNSPFSLDNQNKKKHGDFEIFNIGNQQSVGLEVFIETLEMIIGKKAIKKYIPMQVGDVYDTCANTQKLKERIGYVPNTPLKVGLERFFDWYDDFYIKRKKLH